MSVQIGVGLSITLFPLGNIGVSGGSRPDPPDPPANDNEVEWRMQPLQWRGENVTWR